MCSAGYITFSSLKKLKIKVTFSIQADNTLRTSEGQSNGEVSESNANNTRLLPRILCSLLQTGMVVHLVGIQSLKSHTLEQHVLLTRVKDKLNSVFISMNALFRYKTAGCAESIKDSPLSCALGHKKA